MSEHNARAARLERLTKERETAVKERANDLAIIAALVFPDDLTTRSDTLKVDIALIRAGQILSAARKLAEEKIPPVEDAP